MAYHTDILAKDIFTRTPLYTGGVLDVSTYKELTIDISLSLCSTLVLVSFYRINPNSVPEQVKEVPLTQNGKYSFDMYHFDLIDGSDPYVCTAFGNQIQVTISANHECSGIISIKGKGLA